MGQNYLRSLLALGFQAFLSMRGDLCCAGTGHRSEEDVIMAIWSCVGYTVLLCFTLFKTGSLAKSCIPGALRTEGGFYIGLCTCTQGPDESQNKGCMFNLTKRQLSLLPGGGAYWAYRFSFSAPKTLPGNSAAALCMMLVMLPFFLLAMYEKHGQPLEKVLGISFASR